MSDDESLTNNIENAPLRNESSWSKEETFDFPPQATAETSLSRDDVRKIIHEVIKTELSRMLCNFNESINAILNRELQPINAKIAAIDDSIKFMNIQFDNLLKGHATSKDTIKDLQKENSDIKISIHSLKKCLDQLEQPSRSNNVELQCLLENKQEDLFNIVSEITKVAESAVENRDIQRCTKVATLNPDNTGPRSLALRFASPPVHDQFLTSINYKYNQLLWSLHAAAKTKARELGYKFVWIRGGRIFMRKLQESKVIMIRNMDTLNKLI